MAQAACRFALLLAFSVGRVSDLVTFVCIEIMTLGADAGQIFLA